MKKYGIDAGNTYFIRKTLKIKTTANFKNILEENSDVLFDEKSKCGVYFHMFHPPYQNSIVSVFGKDEKDANKRLQRLMNIKSLCE